MRRALLVAALVAAGGVASASPTPMIHAPDGWRVDAEQAAAIAKTLSAGKPFGDPAATVAAEVYAPPGGARISLVVARATTRDPKLDRGAAAQGAIDDLRAIVRRAQLSGAKSVEDAWETGIAATDAQAQAYLAWHDPEAGTREEARIVVAADAATLVSVTGECLAASDAPAAVVTACKAALASLDPGIARADRVAMAAPPAAGSGSSPSPSPSPGLRDESVRPVLPPARLDDGSRIALPPMSIPQDAPADRRPVYVGAGIVLLAIAFYWNRRNRERFEPEAAKDDKDEDKP